ncbi:MAG TPA: polysaccharide biosynthesis tyrosine autokinase [Vicinamibacteria bacterium]
MSSLESNPSLSGSEREMDVRYYLELLYRGRVLIVACALVAAGLGLVVGFMQTPQFQSGVMLQIEPPTPTFMTVTDALLSGTGGYWQNADFYNTQWKVLRSKSLGEKVVDKLKLKDRPPFKDSLDPGGLFMSHVRIDPVPESRLVVVNVTHTEPKEAALWANTLAEAYIDQSIELRVDSAKKAYQWLQERLSATQASMREAQDRLFKSYQSQDLFVPEGSVSAVTSSITRLNDDFITAQARRITIEAALKQVADMRQSGQSLDAVPQVASDGVVAGFNGQIASLTVDLSRLAEKFKEGHPEVQKVQAQIAQVKKAKDARAIEIVSGLQAEFQQLRKREGELRSAIDGQKSQAAQQSRKATELDTLKKEADSAKGLYEVLLQKLNETDIAASIRSNNATVVEKAAAPLSPVRPQKRKIAAIALLIGLGLGVGLVLGRDYLDNTLRDPEEVERYLHLDLLAAVPRYEQENIHLVTEAYQSLRTALIFGRKDERGQVVLITGTAPQEGKTTTLVNVARLLAGSGESTVVLDCDLRRAQIHHRLGLPREPGFTDLFTKHEDLALIQDTRVPHLSAITAGPPPPNPPAVLAKKQVGDLLERLRDRYEWILIDSPPLASVTDALLLARHADMVVMVVQHNKVDKRLVKRNVAAIRKATPNLLGVVLNAVDVGAKGYGYYYYQQRDEPPMGSGKPVPSGPVGASKA